MKKLIALTMVLAMMLTLFAACNGGANNATEPSAEETTEATDAVTETEETETQPTEGETIASTGALAILENTWAGFPAEEQFSVFGGAMETHSEKMMEDETYQIPNGPGAYDMAYAESLSYSLLIPADQLANVDEAATMIHMMIANNFTSGVVHLTEGTDVAAFTAAVHDAILNNPWMCGFPEKELIAVVDGSYVLIAFGVNDAMTPFQNHFAAAYPEAEIVYNENLA